VDKAIVGYMRIGDFRIGVFVDNFDVALEQLKNIPLRGGGLDPAVQGVARQGYTRQKVYLPLFEDAKTKLQKA